VTTHHPQPGAVRDVLELCAAGLSSEQFLADYLERRGGAWQLVFGGCKLKPNNFTLNVASYNFLPD